MTIEIVNQYLADKAQAKAAGTPLPQHPTSPRLMLDKELCDALPVAEFEYMVKDVEVENMYIRVRPSGAKSIYVERRVNGKTSKARVTDWKKPTHAFKKTRGGKPDIRARARTMLDEMGDGITPAAKRAQRAAEAVQQAMDAELEALQQLSVKSAIQEYIDSGDRAQGTTDNYNTALANLAGWHDYALLDVTKADVVAMHTVVTEDKGPTAANTALKLFRAAWNYQAEEYENMPQAPTITLSSKKKRTRSWGEETRRESIVHEKEMADWWAAVEKLRTNAYTGDGDMMADYLQFAILSGMRRREMTGLTWRHLNFKREELVLQVEDNKGKRKWTLPLTQPLIDILKRREAARDPDGKKYPGPFPFDDPRRAIARVTAWSGVEFSMHDLRRTYATLGEAEAVGVPLSTMKYMLNHSNKSGDVTTGYQIANIENARRYMIKLQNYILNLAGVDDNVVKLEVVANG